MLTNILKLSLENLWVFGVEEKVVVDKRLMGDNSFLYYYHIVHLRIYFIPFF